jgi:hypothetical protein
VHYLKKKVFLVLLVGDSALILQSISVKIPVLSGVQSTVIASKCSRPSSIETLLADYIAYAQRMSLDAASSASSSSSSMWYFLSDFDARDRRSCFLFDFLVFRPIRLNSIRNDLTKFIQTCASMVYSQKCTTDSDCLSDNCDRRNKQCMVPYGNEAPLFAKCFVQQMPVDLKFEWKLMWGMPAIYNSSDVRLLRIYSPFPFLINLRIALTWILLAIPFVDVSGGSQRFSTPFHRQLIDRRLHWFSVTKVSINI